jgi:hypothetical protein
MAVKKTIKEYEQYLNDLYSEMNEEEVLYSLIYLTNKRRGKHTTTSNIRKQYNLGKVGSLVKKLDSIAFTCGFNEWK